jgi:hypothetical protein
LYIVKTVIVMSEQIRVKSILAEQAMSKRLLLHCTFFRSRKNVITNEMKIELIHYLHYIQDKLTWLAIV